VVALICVVTWMLVSGHDALGTWLLAGLLLAHGLVHAMFLVPAPPPALAASGEGQTWPFDLGRSWLVGRVGAGTVTTIGRVLVVAVVVCSALAALATVGVVVPSSLWTALVVASAACSLALLGIGSSPTLLVGVAIDLALLWLALVSSWAPTA
jgi:hypothetical protein